MIYINYKIVCDSCGSSIIEDGNYAPGQEIPKLHTPHVLNGKNICFYCAIDALNYLESKKHA